MKKILDIDNWNRKEHFLFFSKFEEPFFGVTVKVDCTTAYLNAKEKGISFFLYYLFRALKAANEVENFRYRIIENKPYEFPTVNASPTINRPDGTFGFARGFLHALFMGFYASIWVALAVFVYLQYFDNGSIFAAYGHSLETPEMQQYLLQSGVGAQFDSISGGKGAQGIVDAMQSLGAATYASMSLYLSMIFGPVISTVIGLIARRG